MTTEERELRYLKLLAKQYPSIRAASTEIINLTATLHLPKGTEHFVSDIHGEYEAFLHVLRNGSGSIKRKIEEQFANTLVEREKRNLATLIYYPRQKLPLLLKGLEGQEAEWYRITLFRLIKMCRIVSSKYTRATVREALPEDFAYIIEELLHEQESISNRQAYYEAIIAAIIETGRARAFIIAMSELIQRLAIAHLHVIGDVYDRGPGAHIIMDRLMEYHSLDFQWGNHDIVWMGAAAGSAACMANVVRVSLRYANMETLEDGYGISVLPLATFALDIYGDDPCDGFMPRAAGDEEFTENELRLMARMQKAIAIIQFKLEGQLIQRRPEYGMDDRLLLDKIDFETGTIRLNGAEYPLNDTNFPTIDPQAPFQLTSQEKAVVEKLQLAFANSERLQQHVRLLYAKGGMYLVYNGNLLYHGCIIMNEDGSFKPITVDGESHRAKAFMDKAERMVRQGYFSTDPEQKQAGLDMMWYLWSGSDSPLFGKDKMATFERYFIDDPQTHEEKMDPYYDLRDREETARHILAEFGLDPETGHIVNGHVPVKVKKGESPVKAGGKLLVIDGGFSRAYQKKTGIAGYTLIFNSYGFLLASHLSFDSTQRAIEEGEDIHSQTERLERNVTRIRVKDTDRGKTILEQIDELQRLLDAYRAGLIKES
ncbi:MAG: fructose-1,6-bisphosphatase [Candidatus Promineifilaceae bacterium]|nr:fructose-1,6-bisphosphatase [Candidatus Promineifilaceae bacterium]